MLNYDPDESPDPASWLRATEDERITAVRAYHQRVRTRLPRERLHAAIHVVVENQLALEERVVVETFARLQREGLTRHEAIHAIGKVLAEHLYDLQHRKAPASEKEWNAGYFQALRELSAASWRDGR
jgi:hypothetical protein